MENECELFYKTETNGKVLTTPTMQSYFFIKKKFIRIDKGDDKIYLMQNINNIVEFFNHKTDMPCFLSKYIEEVDKKNYDAVLNKIANCNNSITQKAYTLIPAVKLKYYADTETTFGLPFENGFVELKKACGGLQKLEYGDVVGFFSPHEIQKRAFQYTEEKGVFEEFYMRASTGKNSDYNGEDEDRILAFCSMFGFLCHNYKDRANNPCIVLTDYDADGRTRNGGRGKSLLIQAIKHVKETKVKGGMEFDPNYTFVFADLEKSDRVYAIDDVPSNFDYESLYTNILGDISCQRKGSKAESIDFKESPKFMITTNWVIPYDKKNNSTNRRFVEYKFTDYYNLERTPKDEFGQIFFDDWDSEEWDRFYSFVFRCVELFFDKGLIRIEYNKDVDNYKACFENDAVLEEFERIIKYLTESASEITASSFLSEYNDPTNRLRNEKFFHKQNISSMISTFFNFNATNPLYNNWFYKTSKNRKRWEKV